MGLLVSFSISDRYSSITISICIPSPLVSSVVDISKITDFSGPFDNYQASTLDEVQTQFQYPSDK